ncbi:MULTISPECIES: helix-turn-helix transcriptional regulator [Rhizobium]|uniref:helix-turn-helix transcriptional regulator n=1 Tax=Rhizobium TaxID=379 RepID=UPI000522EA12|nr:MULTISPECIES: AlpA family phage regulatory protein [Rhizobium]KPN28864.1 AlpA family transcriptional regulator [Rhizobium brockwellii]QJX07125.1 AlpA family phage regulatory protein [Rhizobium brockwellii]TAX41206.1 AlpA family phage regulatory protein [Rhizobium leguminosarum]TAX94106.1 AlpA family phage regulatory protein [Rhizobium leguminosarum]TAX98644.1 AlpA family phage regulatory protein [Rhizobium leguminosarum]
MSSNKLLPIGEVVERTSLSRRTLYREISENRFPKSVQLTARRVGWPEADINAWIVHKIAVRDEVAA